VSEDPSRAGWLQQARSYLRHADPVLARLVNRWPDTAECERRHASPAYSRSIRAAKEA
jgi:hypothetical protein